MPYNEPLADRIRISLAEKNTDFEEKKMFGGIAFMVAEKMACGIIKEDLMVRCTEANYLPSLEKPHCLEMKFTGKPMKGFLQIEPSGFETDRQLGNWLDLGIEFAQTAPPGKKKAAKPKG